MILLLEMSFTDKLDTLVPKEGLKDLQQTEQRLIETIFMYLPMNLLFLKSS